MKKWYTYPLFALLFIVVVSIVLARFVSPLFSRSLDCHTWRSVALSPSDQGSSFTSVALLNANDAWIAGRHHDATANVSRPLVEHWDGHRWQTFFLPDPDNLDVMVNGIAVVSQSDAWVVGYMYTTPGTTIALAAHWDGHSWQTLPTDSSSDLSKNNSDSELYGVTALADNNVWAVGSTFSGGFSQTLVEHWDGSSLKRVSSPNVADENNRLASVSALSASDIWVVGTSQGYQGSGLTLVEHWDGSHWGIVPSPDPSLTSNVLASVATASTNDVWAVGAMIPKLSTLSSAGGYKQAHDRPLIETDGLIAHWNGQNWQVSSFPRLGQHQVLLSVTAYSSQDVWATGLFVVDSAQGQVWHGLLVHWDGTAWHSEQDPRAQYINAIATSAAGGLWSVGIASSLQSPGSDQAIAEACT